MSLPLFEKVTCKNCSKPIEGIKFYKTVNIEQEPELLYQVLLGKINNYTCASCGHFEPLAEPFLYSDTTAKGRKIMIFCLPEDSSQSTIASAFEAIKMTEKKSLFHKLFKKLEVITGVETDYDNFVRFVSDVMKEKVENGLLEKSYFDTQLSQCLSGPKPLKECLCHDPSCSKCLGSNCTDDSCIIHTKENKQKWLRNYEKK